MQKTPVEDIVLKKGLTADSLVKKMYNSGGFTSKKLALGVDILEKMIKDEKCFNFLSFPACIISTGTRGIIKELIKRKIFDVVITTCGTLDHDLARLWRDYYHGYFMVDDRQLHKKGINRLGNIFIPNECYGTILEEKLQPIFKKLFTKNKKWSTKDLIWEIGKEIEKEERHEESLTYWCWKNKIPMFVPGITDGAFGSQIWMYYQQNRSIAVDLLKDEQELSDLTFDVEKTGAFIIGGGISKHHTIWWNQFRDGLDYTVYITTAVEYDGSLSGAETREAISWGKINEKADNVSVYGDATMILPMMISALIDRM
ncbi:MAG: deoxyhypusine synthase [Candidatus Thermoplasmatota archaeon]